MFSEVLEFLGPSFAAAGFEPVGAVSDNVCGDGLQQRVVPVIQRHRIWQHWQELIERLHGAIEADLIGADTRLHRGFPQLQNSSPTRQI